MNLAKPKVEMAAEMTSFSRPKAARCPVKAAADPSDRVEDTRTKDVERDEGIPGEGERTSETLALFGLVTVKFLRA